MGKYDETIKVLGRIDLNKDGYICSDDLQASLNNKDIGNFFSKKVTRNKLEDERLEAFIRNLIQKIQVPLNTFYLEMDTDNDRMVNIHEFVAAFRRISDLKQDTLEEIFRYLDAKNLGMISFEQFNEAFTAPQFTQNTLTHEKKFVLKKTKLIDNFDW